MWLESPRAEFWAARPLKGARSATRATAERRVRIDRRWIEVRVGFRLSELTTEPRSGYRTPPRRGLVFRLAKPHASPMDIEITPKKTPITLPTVRLHHVCISLSRFPGKKMPKKNSGVCLEQVRLIC